jgi:hypothetical protein
MSETWGMRLKHAWDIFRNRDPTEEYVEQTIGPGTTFRADRSFLRLTNERSIVTALYTRIAIDVSSIPIQHVKLDDDGRYQETIQSGLNYVLTQEANIDQAAKPFLRDILISMFDEGYVAVVPVDTTLNAKVSGSYDILTMRTGKILEWYPEHVKVRVYNDKTGLKEELILPKKMVAIIENPLYSVMNEPNGTLKRLIRKLNILDAIDEQSGSGKLDLLIQLPYVIKSTARQEQAERRKKSVEDQLSNSKYGIAYIDGTEKVTQLNRPAENNLMAQITYLTSMLYSQLGITEEVFIGKADAATMLNYQNRTIIPLLLSVIDEFNRKFLTKTARTQKQSLMYFKDAFSLAPISEIANMADKFTRNEILSSNEIRSAIGYKPSTSAGANDLRNKNLNSATEDPLAKEKPPGTDTTSKGDANNAQV